MQATKPAQDPDRLLTPEEVAAMFGVDIRTVRRWGNSGQLQGVRTPSRRHRFREDYIMALFRRHGR